LGLGKSAGNGAGNGEGEMDEEGEDMEPGRTGLDPCLAEL